MSESPAQVNIYFYCFKKIRILGCVVHKSTLENCLAETLLTILQTLKNLIKPSLNLWKFKLSIYYPLKICSLIFCHILVLYYHHIIALFPVANQKPRWFWHWIIELKNIIVYIQIISPSSVHLGGAVCTAPPPSSSSGSVFASSLSRSFSCQPPSP